MGRLSDAEMTEALRIAERDDCDVEHYGGRSQHETVCAALLDRDADLRALTAWASTLIDDLGTDAMGHEAPGDVRSILVRVKGGA